MIRNLIEIENDPPPPPSGGFYIAADNQWRPKRGGSGFRNEIYVEVGQDEGSACGIFLTPSGARKFAKGLLWRANKAEKENLKGS